MLKKYIMKNYNYKGFYVEVVSNGMHKFYSLFDGRYVYFDAKKDVKLYIDEFLNQF